MRLPFPGIVIPKTTTENVRLLPSERSLRLAALSTIVALAAWLRISNLASLGYANHYYSAAVVSMLKSWHNFLFVAAEPGGMVSVDKPPLGLWLQTISAYFLGVNGFAVLLPQLLAGILSVIVIYHLVRRSFGTAAGLLAALVLAITPVAVATDRNNTIDSTLILTLLLAAWAFIKATESGKLRFLLLGAALVGIGFNIKMLEAYLPLPGFYALYVLGSSETLRRKIGKLVLASALLLVISLSWAVAVDLTPASQRPYVGSSGDNSEMSLILGYNGIDRLIGMFGRRGSAGVGFRGAGSPRSFPGQNGTFPPPAGGFLQPFPNRIDGLPRQGGFPNSRGPLLGRGAPGAFGGGISGTGHAGPLRLFIPPLSKEVGWLLPFGILGALLLLFSKRLRWPLGLEHRTLIVWGGWLLAGGIFFSIAGFFHEYYLSTLAPPLAVLVAIGAYQLWRLHERLPWLAAILLLAGAGGTLAFQMRTARAFTANIWWIPVALAMFAGGATGLFLAMKWKPQRTAQVSFACIMTALLITPGIWSELTNRYASENQSLPSAYGGQTIEPGNLGGLQINQALLNYLQENTKGSKYLMAVPSSMQGADYVLATGRPVLYLGGFMGQDQVVTPEKLAEMVRQGELRYIYWDARGRGFGQQPDISLWITSTCRAVPGFDTATRNSGAPDGTSQGVGGSRAGQTGGFPRGFEDIQVSLYDCGS